MHWVLAVHLMLFLDISATCPTQSFPVASLLPGSWRNEADRLHKRLRRAHNPQQHTWRATHLLVGVTRYVQTLLCFGHEVPSAEALTKAHAEALAAGSGCCCSTCCARNAPDQPQQAHEASAVLHLSCRGLSSSLATQAERRPRVYQLQANVLTMNDRQCSRPKGGKPI